VAREFEKVALERDTMARVQNQLATQIEILQKSQSTRNQGLRDLELPISTSYRRNYPH